MQLLNKMAGRASIIGVVQPIVIKTGGGIFATAFSDNKAVKAGVLFFFLCDSGNKVSLFQSVQVPSSFICNCSGYESDAMWCPHFFRFIRAEGLIPAVSHPLWMAVVPQS